MSMTRRSLKPTGYMMFLAFAHLPFFLAAVYCMAEVANVGLLGLDWSTFWRPAGFTAASGWFVWHFEKFAGMDPYGDKVENGFAKFLFRGCAPVGAAIAAFYGEHAAFGLAAAAMAIGEAEIARVDKKG